LATLRLRDRDAAVSEEGIIFRVFGYSHPRNAYVCDVEYAPAQLFKSSVPKAFRNDGDSVFYKFYDDEGWKFIQTNLPKYAVFHEMLGRKVAGISKSDIAEVRGPDEKLKVLIQREPSDALVRATAKVLELITKCSSLSIEDFGVFGSMLHGFHHPQFSDIDLVVYGKNEIAELHEALEELYEDKSSPFRNEFATEDAVRGKNWRFLNFSAEEYVWHQRRKLIYALFKDDNSGRIIKTEFEPVKKWTEIINEYDPAVRIAQKGWVKMIARVTRNVDASFIPSVYEVEPIELIEGTNDALGVHRIVSYMEEFRMQAWEGERVYVEGNLEEIKTPKDSFHQIALTYCPRYYEQTLKLIL
jgi:predicted nucleotidyltransferase